LSVVDANDRLVEIISRRDLDIALHHGFSHAPVKGYMTTNLRTITPDTPLPEIESLMMTFDIGRLPVLEAEQLVGIVTRTDVLRELHQAGLRDQEPEEAESEQTLRDYCLLPGVVQNLLRQRLLPSLWNVLLQTAEQAEQRGWQLYLVGGAVRDLLLAKPDQPLLIDDIDLVVDGFHRAADRLLDGAEHYQAAGVEMAKSLQQLYPTARLQTHGRFQTAALLWHNDPVLDSLWIDIATARTEFYPYPAANPEVEASSIRQDLYRRDFTINALAIRLTPPRMGELLDFFGGVVDLQSKQIRVLHPNSFIEDPTRIYRAVRFAVRLGFEIDSQTEGYIRTAIASGIYHRIQAEVEKTPALQTRLWQELRYILEARYWKPALELLADLGAICCIHPDLELNDALWWQLRLVDRWLKRFDQLATLEHWLILLELMLSHLEVEARVKVAENFQLPADSIQRLQTLDQNQTAIVEALPNCQRPSQVVRELGQYDLSTLILVAVTVPRSMRRQIWQYLTCWSQVKAPIDGNDLKALGYKPGRQYKQILDQLLSATLDGEITNRAEAEAFLAAQFPLSLQ
jgi:tRNA nucleotidyltransferase (CCA-adding enzyme)